MSCVEYESVELEGSASEQQGSDAQMPKPFVVPGPSYSHENQVIRRVAEILDFELERGLMPS